MTNRINALPTYPYLETSLQEWIVNSPEGERSARENAAQEIMGCYARSSLPPRDILDLSGLQITSLAGVRFPPGPPDSLDLSGTQITSLDGVHFPPDLLGLDLNGTQITSLDGVRFPPNLQTLFFGWTRIVSIPESLALLPRTCRLSSQNCPLSADAIDSFRRAIEAARTQDPSRGPDWIHEARSSSTTSSLEAFSHLIRERHPDFNMPAFDEPQTSQLKEFLVKIQNTADFHSALTKTKLIDTIHLILCAASTSSKFKQNLFLLLNDALDSCSDRTAITLNRIDLQRRLDTSSGINPELLIGYRRLQLLHEEAIAIIKGKCLGGDAIEPMLYLQTRLRESLKLPIVTEGMLYAGMANITDKELEQITERILRATSHEKILSIFTKTPEITYDDQGRTKQIGDLSPTNPFLADISKLWADQLQACFHVDFKRIAPSVEEMTDPEKMKEWQLKRESLILRLTQELVIQSR